MNDATLSDQKAQLRKSTLAKRDGLSAEQQIELSLRACGHGEGAPDFDANSFQPGTVVSGFHPIRSEIDPRPLMFHLMRMGARLCLPVVEDKETIIFRELNREAPLIKTGFGTIGPDENAEVLDPQIMLVPLSVFDQQGGRIGYGAGYYDRAIERLEEKGISPRLIGMAFSLQEIDSVPMENHDRFLHGIITDTGFIPVSSAA